MNTLLLALAQNDTSASMAVTDGNFIPILAIVLGICGIAAPATALHTARLWAQSQPELSGTLFGGAVAVSLMSILTGAVILLAVVGWLPPLSELIG